MFGGGTDGNEQLTAIAAVILLVLFAVLGITIVRIGQLLWLHLFLGVLLVGPVALKLASTGYRFARYYSANSAYRRKGPPHSLMRMLGPFVILSTLAVFFTGLLLLIDGPGAPSILRLLHKLSFFAGSRWSACTCSGTSWRCLRRCARSVPPSAPPQPPGFARSCNGRVRRARRWPRAGPAVLPDIPAGPRADVGLPPHRLRHELGNTTYANARSDNTLMPLFGA